MEQHRKTDGGILQGCRHTTLVLNHRERNRVIFECIRCLDRIKFDSVVVCGTSGLLVGPQISELLNKNLVIVRKRNEKRYSPFHIEGAYPGDYVVVDDLVCSGSTLKHILNNIKEEYPKAKCCGVYSYIQADCAYSKVPEVFEKEYKLPYLNPL